ncbi:MAG: hypothetical protein WD470_04435 [Rhodospirillaceae bacterium]
MKRRFRLLPVVIFTATLALTLKIGAIWHDSGIAVATATAQEAATAQDAGAAPEGAAAPAASASGESAPAADAGPRREGGRAVVGDEFDPSSVTQAEFEVLQRLAHRRGELDTLRKDLALRETLLDATEKRLNAKMTELTELKTLIEGLLKRHDEEQEAKLRSLVKIYETMKAKSAAQIFERLEMDVLLDVVERMREAKTAPIFAAMDPAKAKAVTARLAERRDLPEPSVAGEGG